MANDENDVQDGGQGGGFNPELNQAQKDANGAAFASAVAAYGISTDFGNATDRQIKNFWNSQSLKYMGVNWNGENANISKFITDFGITYGSKITHSYSLLGDIGLTESGQIPYILQNGDSIEFDYHGNPFNISLSQIIETVVGTEVETDGLIGIAATLSAIISTTGAQNQNKFLISISTRGKSIENADGWIKWHGEYKKVNDRFTELVLYMDEAKLEISFVTSKGDIQKSYHTISDSFNIYSLYFDSAYFDSVLTITFDYGSGEHGGGGEGGSGVSVLSFTAISGVSGRHADPFFLQKSTTPATRSEIPPYGCGGLGGHGGGGGAGSSTVVIRKFTSGKAESVDQIAIVKRHGYGSGGGQGGIGGDGCILVFW